MFNSFIKRRLYGFGVLCSLEKISSFEIADVAYTYSFIASLGMERIVLGVNTITL